MPGATPHFGFLITDIARLLRADFGERVRILGRVRDNLTGTPASPARRGASRDR